MKVLTANRLSDGITVWYCQSGWSEAFAGVQIAEDTNSESRLAALGAMAFANNEVVDVNLIDVKIVDGKACPIRLRERIRVGGPSIVYHGTSAV